MSELTLLRWDAASQNWIEQHIALEPGATIILPGEPVAPPLVRVKTIARCNVRNAPAAGNSTDVGDLDIGKVMVAKPQGDWYELHLYVHKSMVQEAA